MPLPTLPLRLALSGLVYMSRNFYRNIACPLVGVMTTFACPRQGGNDGTLPVPVKGGMMEHCLPPLRGEWWNDGEKNGEPLKKLSFIHVHWIGTLILEISWKCPPLGFRPRFIVLSRLCLS